MLMRVIPVEKAHVFQRFAVGENVVADLLHAVWQEISANWCTSETHTHQRSLHTLRQRHRLKRLTALKEKASTVPTVAGTVTAVMTVLVPA